MRRDEEGGGETHLSPLINIVFLGASGGGKQQFISATTTRNIHEKGGHGRDIAEDTAGTGGRDIGGVAPDAARTGDKREGKIFRFVYVIDDYLHPSPLPPCQSPYKASRRVSLLSLSQCCI